MKIAVLTMMRHSFEVYGFTKKYQYFEKKTLFFLQIIRLIKGDSMTKNSFLFFLQIITFINDDRMSKNSFLAEATLKACVRYFHLSFMF